MQRGSICSSRGPARSCPSWASLTPFPRFAAGWTTFRSRSSSRPFARGTDEAVEWLDRLEADHDNMRAALDRLHAGGEGELKLRLAGALSNMWYLRGHAAEGRRRLEGALAADPHPTAARAKALNG